MNPVYKKLLAKPGYRIAVLHGPADFPTGADDLPEAGELVTDAADLVLLFAASAQELADRLPQALAALAPKGLLWVAYPKKSSKIKTDISRDVGWDAARAQDLQGVSLISVDDTWSAMRLRKSDEIGK